MTATETLLRVVVVGAGPAGLAAARAAARPGVAVTLLDNNPAPGGQIWRSGPKHPPPSRSKAAQQSLIRCGVTIYTGCHVVGIRVPGVLILDAPNADNVPTALAWDKLILATGARERFLPFPGWTLPGVTGAGAAQALVKGGVPAHGKRVVVAGSGPLLLASAATLRAAGADVLMVVEQAPARAMLHFARRLIHWPRKLAKAAILRAQLASVPYHWNSHIIAAEGEGQLHSLRVSIDGFEKTIACDWLACGFGLQANLELAYALGCEVDTVHGLPAVKIDQQQQTSVTGVFAAGETTGIGGLDKAWAEGHRAGLAAIGKIAKPGLTGHAAFGELLSTTFALRPELMRLANGDTTVCRCEDVSLADLREHADWRTAKLRTRCGMGACQGRICAPVCHDVLGWQLPGPSLQHVIRQPLQPVSLNRLLCGLKDMPS